MREPFIGQEFRREHDEEYNEKEGVAREMRTVILVADASHE